MTDRIDDLVLLAEKGMKWTRVGAFRDLWDAPRGEPIFCIYDGQTYIPAVPVAHRHWDPCKSLDDAGMLMCAMGIDLIAQTDDADPEKIVTWEATDSSGLHNVSARVDGNTPAAIACAVTECALLIVRAQARAEEAGHGD